MGKQGCENIPNYQTIERIIRNSFESKEKYYGWKSNIHLKELQDIAKNKQGECLSPEYKNSRIKLEFSCKEGHKFEMRPDNVKEGHWCPECAGKKKLTLKEFQDIAEDKEGECLSPEYKNTHSKLKFRCKKGHEFESNPSDIKSGKWCPDCAGNKKLILKEFQDIAKDKEGECLSPEYKNTHSKLKFRCNKEHEFEMRPDHIKEGHWCPTCSEGTSERICRGLFEAIFNKEFKKARPEWLKNSEGHQLELDGYNDELKLAFECQGRQHYEFPNHCHKTIADFITQKFNDIQKMAQIKEHGIILIEIPASVEHDKKQKYIIGQCRLKGVEVPEIKSKIDWEKFRWDINNNNESVINWI